jgi:hypothetical protein
MHVLCACKVQKHSRMHIKESAEPVYIKKPKNENMYANDGTKQSSDKVSKSKHHITTTNSQYVYKENTSRRVYNRETLNSKKCTARVCSAPAHIE